MSERGGDNYNISASQVKAHSSCPKQWEFRYRSEKEPTKDNEEYLRLGSRIHESIEETLTAESPPPLTHEEAVSAGIQNLYSEKDEYPIPDDMYDDGLQYCETAANFISDRAKNGFKRNGERTSPLEVRDVEKRIEYRIDRSDVETGVTAILDLIAEPGVIVDWKTGRIRDETPHEEKIQGSVYMGAYLDEYGEPPEFIKFVYVKEGKVRMLEPADDIWEYMVNRAKALVMDKEEGIFEPEPGDQCFWCGYEYFCEGSPVGYGGVPYEEY